ncbi:hypothetical protein MTR_2g450480 [Medicago truncatula]|uniref:Disease resistance protein At4g27190-like leucine-rich repeats domain-containing protein n=1 Tax=Medicago truncatula TaxID=3880 RepID=A0A072VID8_MEDTR|nr:hypothetical protein MTR_2g450480 [Medicago truncatula]
MRIEECKELKHIIEDDLENKKSSNFMAAKTVGFPKLQSLVVEKCKMLKYVFPISICKELPELEALVISEAYKLEEIFVCEEDETGHPDTCSENSSSETTEDIASEIEVEVASGHMSTSSQLEGSTSEKPVAEPLCIISATENEPPIQGVEITVEEVTALTNTKTLKSSTYSKSLCSSSQSVRLSIEDIDNVASQETSQTNINQVSLSLIIKEQFPMDDEIISKSKPSPSIIYPIASQFPLIPPKDFDLYLHMESLYRQFQEVSKGRSNGNENQNAQITKEFSAWIEAEAASRHKLTSSQGNEISFEEGTTSTCDKTITSATHLEVVDGKTCIPFSSIVNIINLPSTNYVDIGDSYETFAIEDIDKQIKEDSLLAFETFLTGVPSFSIRTLLQELKTLLDSSSDLDHLVSDQESKSKLISLLHGLNQHQGLLPSDVKEFFEKVNTFFNYIINKHATYQQLLMKHKQLLDLKPGLLFKLLIAKSKQFHIVSETSTANAQIHKRSLEIDELRKQLEDLENQIDDLKSVVNKCDVQKEELNTECSEWAQQSKEFASALASTEVDLREAERARNLAAEGFSNLKSSFPTF